MARVRREWLGRRVGAERGAQVACRLVEIGGGLAHRLGPNDGPMGPSLG
jgi:hypothetical protein